jgi:hypothetical protein
MIPSFPLQFSCQLHTSILVVLRADFNTADNFYVNFPANDLAYLQEKCRHGIDSVTAFSSIRCAEEVNRFWWQLSVQFDH